MTGTMHNEISRATALIEDILGGPRRFTSHEVADMVDVPVYRARRFWRALGFANVAEDAVEFTDTDVASLRSLLKFVDTELLDESEAIHLTRILGQTCARIAGSQVETLADRSDPRKETGIGDTALPEQSIPELEQLLVYAWRRQLAAKIQGSGNPDTKTVSTESAVGFVDLVGFTALSKHLTDQELTRLIGRFERNSSDIITAHGGRVVKTLGDEVLFASTEPTVIADTALDLVQAFTHDREVPAVRIGLAYGDVVSYLGDLFGTTVNLASRLTSLAEPNSILVAPRLADAINEHNGYLLHRARPTTAQGIGNIHPSVLHNPDG